MLTPSSTFINPTLDSNCFIPKTLTFSLSIPPSPMDEEFQESDIIFSDNDRQQNPPHTNAHDDDSHRQHDSRAMHDVNSNKSKKKMAVNSLPINVPETTSISQCVDSDDNSEGLGEEMVPPHVIVGQRIARKTAFSVCTGKGRTLKGRDLSQVRNLILKMTGFLEE